MAIHLPATEELEAQLDARGWAHAGALLSSAACRRIAALYEADAHFRSRVVMARHGFGRGEYKYFAYPLPDAAQALRTAFYERLAPVANRWMAAMGSPTRYPPRHEAFLRQCHEAGQQRPTPLLLRYGEGDYNCLHQDLYGDIHFPMQLIVLLSRPQEDFTGGELVLTEQRPRMQSRVQVVPLAQGEGAVIAVNQRPVKGTRGSYRVTMRHGVSEIRSGSRHTLGVVLHDAR
jgi:hypothetical protein